MDVEYRPIPEDVIPGRRLGRHVNHDPRSLNFLVRPDGTVASKRWTRRTPILDQGDLGSCTGNAATGVLGTDPFYATLGGKLLDENEAISLYSTATALDSFPGTYPPTDTGSDGLSVAKAAKAAGLISGYTHITTIPAAQTAIQTGPFIVGSDWYEGFDTPDADGVVQPTGAVRGGHEYECVSYDALNDLWEFANSWGPTWGVAGHFCYSTATFAKLLAAQGDATVFVPINQPAPTPTPPGPGALFPVSALVAAHIHASALRAKLTDAQWLEHHLRIYFHIAEDV